MGLICRAQAHSQKGFQETTSRRNRQNSSLMGWYSLWSYAKRLRGCTVYLRDDQSILRRVWTTNVRNCQLSRWNCHSNVHSLNFYSRRFLWISHARSNSRDSTPRHCFHFRKNDLRQCSSNWYASIWCSPNGHESIQFHANSSNSISRSQTFLKNLYSR